jgi:UPF0755 protein
MKWKLLFAVAVVAVLGAAALWLMSELRVEKYAGYTEPVLIDFARGTSSRQLAAKLEQTGVLKHGWYLLAARALRPSARMQAGEYFFDRPLTPAEVLDKLIRGEIYTKELRVPEGSNMFDIAEIVEQSGFGTAAAFLKAARNPALIQDMAPTAPSLEGYLFPSTYRFRPRASAEDIVKAMTQQFRKAWKEAGGQGDVQRTLTLASMVEREAKIPEERPRIASVYANRMRIGMKLDCDPTVIYAALLAGRWRGTIYRSDLDRDSPYNTYLHAGIPPGPIANPGMASLRAALAPETTDYLFFVALPDGSGHHAFSRDMAAHSRAVAEYRKGSPETDAKTHDGKTGGGGVPARTTARGNHRGTGR